MEPSIPFYTLLKSVDTEDIPYEKVRTLDLPLEIKNVASELESQTLFAQTYAPKPGIIFTQTTDPNIRSKPHFRKHCKYCHKSNHSVSRCFFLFNPKVKKEKGFLIPDKIQPRLRNHSFNNIKAYQNQIHPKGQPSLYVISYSSRISYASRHRSSTYWSSRFRTPSTSLSSVNYLDPTLEIDITSGTILLHISLHQKHVSDLRLPLEDLSKTYFQTLPGILATIMKTFRGQKTQLGLTCKPLEWKMLPLQKKKIKNTDSFGSSYLPLWNNWTI